MTTAPGICGPSVALCASPCWRGTALRDSAERILRAAQRSGGRVDLEAVSRWLAEAARCERGECETEVRT